MTRRSLVRTLARLIVRDSARDLARCVAARQERAARDVLYPTTSRAVTGAPQMPPIGAAAVTTVEARGSVSSHPAAVSRDRCGESDPAPGAALTRQGAQALTREGRQDGPSQGPATSAVPTPGSRTGVVPNEAPAELVTPGRMTHPRGDADEHAAE